MSSSWAGGESQGGGGGGGTQVPNGYPLPNIRAVNAKIYGRSTHLKAKKGAVNCKLKRNKGCNYQDVFVFTLFYEIHGMHYNHDMLYEQN